MRSTPLQTLDYQLLAERDKAQLGLIVLQSDVTIEDEFRYYYNGCDLSLLCNRIPFENEVNAETLARMEGHLQSTMSLFPLNTCFDALGYACTSGALHIGSDQIARLVGNERECLAVTDPMKAVLAALEWVGATRIAYLAPYSVTVCKAMIERFRANGIDVVVAASFDESQDQHVGRISPECIADAAITLCRNTAPGEIDAVFIACTNMKAAHVIPAIETATGIHALSSNLVLAWHMARLAGSPMIDVSKGSLCR